MRNRDHKLFHGRQPGISHSASHIDADAYADPNANRGALASAIVCANLSAVAKAVPKSLASANIFSVNHADAPSIFDAISESHGAAFHWSIVCADASARTWSNI